MGVSPLRFRDKLSKMEPEEIWKQYCSFLDLSMEQYMGIQFRLLEEQIQLFGRSGLGQRIFRGKIPASVDEFRQTVPLTTYDDYADVLLQKRVEMLPSEPMVWLETTWESAVLQGNAGRVPEQHPCGYAACRIEAKGEVYAQAERQNAVLSGSAAVCDRLVSATD